MRTTRAFLSYIEPVLFPDGEAIDAESGEADKTHRSCQMPRPCPQIPSGRTTRMDKTCPTNSSEIFKKTGGGRFVGILMDVEALSSFLEREFPQVNADGMAFTVTDAGAGFASMRLDPMDRHLRPGGTVSGPTLFALADLTAYVAILAQIGPVALAVTTNLNINFLRKPELGPIDATAKAAETRQAARGGRHFYDQRRQRRTGGTCNLDLFDPAAGIAATLPVIAPGPPIISLRRRPSPSHDPFRHRPAPRWSSRTGRPGPSPGVWHPPRSGR